MWGPGLVNIKFLLYMDKRVTMKCAIMYILYIIPFKTLICSHLTGIIFLCGIKIYLVYVHPKAYFTWVSSHMSSVTLSLSLSLSIFLSISLALSIIYLYLAITYLYHLTIYHLFIYHLSFIYLSVIHLSNLYQLFTIYSPTRNSVSFEQNP